MLQYTTKYTGAKKRAAGYALDSGLRQNDGVGY